MAVAVCLGIGIFGCQISPVRVGLWITLSLALFVVSAICRKHRRLALPAAAGGIILIGLSAAQIERFKFPANSIATYTTSTDRLSEIELYIDQSPRLLIPSSGELRALPPKQTSHAVVRAIRTQLGWVASSGNISLFIEEPNPQLAAGQTVRAIGMLQRPSAPTNPGEFDFAAYERDQRILASFRVNHADGVQIMSRRSPGPIVWLRDTARSLLARGFNDRTALDHALLRALVFGDPDPQLRDVQDEFIRTGLVHQLSISGLHIAIVGGMVLLLCRLMRMSPRVSIVTAMMFVLLYATVALPSWPGWRSVIMCSVASLGLLGRRSVSGLQLLSIALCIILLIHPADLHNGGFQISLAAVLGLILLSRNASVEMRDWWRGPDARAVPRRPQGAIRGMGSAIGRFILASLGAGLVAWVASMPLVAYRYGQLNTWSVPASVALLPLTVLALIGGILKIFLTLLLPGQAGAWAMMASWPVGWMRAVIHAMDHLPGASIPLAGPTLGVLCIYYLLLAGGALRGDGAIVRWVRRLAPLTACALFLFCSMTGKNVTLIRGPHVLRVTLLNLGAGQAAVIRPSAGHAILIDAGSSTVSDVGRHLIEPFLRNQGCTQIDKIFLSHGDFDHISATASLLQTYNRPPVFLSPHFRRNAVGNVAAQSLLKSLDDARAPPTLVHRGDHVDFGDGATVDVLWPPVNCDMNSNNCGLVLMVHYAGRTILFPADIQEPAERELLKDPAQLRADVLIAPHHGSAEITTAQFVQAVHPQYILASNAARLTHKQKTFDAQEAAIALYRTHREGAIALSIDSSGKIEISTYLNVPPQGNGSLQTSIDAR